MTYTIHRPRIKTSPLSTGTTILSGNVNMLHFFNYVISKNWIPRSSTPYQICNGVELVTTNSRSEKFTVNNFSINKKAYS